MRTAVDSPWGVCRVTLYADGNAIDLALPDDVPVAALMPVLHDLARERGIGLHQLAVPGRGPLEPGLTLRENHIRDGSILTTLTVAGPVHRPPVIDAAAMVAGACRTAPWLRRPMVARRMGLAVAAAMAGLTGAVLVPGEPGLAHVLLAAAATSVVAVVAARTVGDPAGVAAAAASGALLCTAAALAATLCGLDITQAGVVLAVAAVLLLTLTTRVVVRLHGAQLLAAEAADAHRLSNGLAGGAAVGAALGVLAAGSAAPAWSRCAFAAAVAAVLLLRTRAYPGALPSTALAGAGMTCCAVVLVDLQQHDPALTWLVCLLALSTGAGAAWLGAHPPAVTLSPVSARLLRALEHVLLMAVVPLACWSLDAVEQARRWVS
ncbi:MAG: EsaB/YukD family protein [Mycobacterium sp.]